MASFEVEQALANTTVEERERAFLITDPKQQDNPIVFANNAFLRITGYSRAETIGRNCRFLQGPETNRETVRALRHAILDGQVVKVDICNYTHAGEPFWNRLQIRPVFDEAGGLKCFVGVQSLIVAEDIDEIPRITNPIRVK